MVDVINALNTLTWPGAFGLGALVIGAISIFSVIWR